MPEERCPDSGAGPDRREWVVRTARTHPAPHPPTPALLGPTGPASLVWDLLAGSVVGGQVPGITHPVYPPGMHPGTAVPACPHCRYVGRSGVRVSGNSRFWRSVGEPRGVEHTAVSGSQAGYIQLLVVRPLVGARGRVMDHVY